MFLFLLGDVAPSAPRLSDEFRISAKQNMPTAILNRRLLTCSGPIYTLFPSWLDFASHCSSANPISQDGPSVNSLRITRCASGS